MILYKFILFMVINSQLQDIEIESGLYLVSTPIGNLDDITLRAIKILKKSDYILCEDTRISQILLRKYDIKSKLISNHKFNEKKNLSKILENLRDGSLISLISDAGTPCISDPGTILINECVKNDIKIIPIPGPSSVTTAVSISGFSEKFFFYGFFPEKKKIIEQDFSYLSNLDCSIIFFISSRKIKKNIPILKRFFVKRKILICKEMTKYYEEFIRTEVDQLHKLDFELKGELTLVISEKTSKYKSSQVLSESDKKIIKDLKNKLSTKEIINLINNYSNLPKKEIYNYCLKLKNEK